MTSAAASRSCERYFARGLSGRRIPLRAPTGRSRPAPFAAGRAGPRRPPRAWPPSVPSACSIDTRPSATITSSSTMARWASRRFTASNGSSAFLRFRRRLLLGLVVFVALLAWLVGQVDRVCLLAEPGNAEAVLGVHDRLGGAFDQQPLAVERERGTDESLRWLDSPEGPAHGIPEWSSAHLAGLP